MKRRPLAPPAPGLIASSWRDALPPERIAPILRFMHDTWRGTVALNMPRFRMKEPEPRLTKTLRIRLQKLRKSVGLTGSFDMEVPEAELDETTGEFVDQARSDIRYFSDRHSQELLVIFEFKKMRHKSGDRLDYWKEGILRFVDGRYSRQECLGFMAGITCNDEGLAVPALRTALQIPATANLTKMIRDAEGRLLRPVEPEVASWLHFQTMHSRTNVPGAPDIFLGHMFLRLPEDATKAAGEEDLEEPN